MKYNIVTAWGSKTAMELTYEDVADIMAELFAIIGADTIYLY